MSSGKSLKIVVVGDGAVGKTCLLIRFVKGQMPTTYDRTIFENHSQLMVVDGKTVREILPAFLCTITVKVLTRFNFIQVNFTKYN